MSNKSNRRVTLPEHTDISSKTDNSSPQSMPQRVIFEKRAKRINNMKYNPSERHKRQLHRLRTSLRYKTRDKRQHIFDPLIRRKAKHINNFHKKGSMWLENTSFIGESTGAESSKNRENTLKSKLDKMNNISSGYGDIRKLIEKKKARIRSAHPIMKHNFNPVGPNLNTSLTFSKKESKQYSNANLNRSSRQCKVQHAWLLRQNYTYGQEKVSWC